MFVERSGMGAEEISDERYEAIGIFDGVTRLGEIAGEGPKIISSAIAGPPKPSPWHGMHSDESDAGAQPRRRPR